MGKLATVLTVVGTRDNLSESKSLANFVWAASTKRGHKLIQRAWQRHLHVYLLFVTIDASDHQAYINGFAKMTSNAEKPPRNWKVPGRWDRMPCFNIEWLLLKCMPATSLQSLQLSQPSDIDVAKLSTTQQIALVNHLQNPSHHFANRTELSHLWQMIKPRDASPSRKHKVSKD